MKDLIIEDFPMSEIEFEKRFCTEQACMDYLAKMKWPEGFCCQGVPTITDWEGAGCL